MIVESVLLGVLWAAVLARVPTLWRDRRQRAMWGALFAFALCNTAAFPPVDAALRTPILPHLFGVVAAFFLLRFIDLVVGGGGRRWQFWLTAGVLVLLVGLAAVAGGIGTRAAALAGDLRPAAVAYWVVLEAYVGAVLVTATRLFWTVGRAAPAGLPRLGLGSVAAGSLLLALYAAVKTVLIVAHGFGVPVRFAAIEPAAHAVQTGAALLIVAGGLVPASRRAGASAGAYRSLLVLRPLWTAMRDAFPQVILFSPRRAVLELAGVDDVHLRLYRRVIEIRDGMLALRDHLPDRVPAADDPAVTEARAIALALRRRARGEPPAGRAGGWATGGGAAGGWAAGGWAEVGPDMADEVAWLGRVSAAYRELRDSGWPGDVDPDEFVSPDAAPTPRPSGSAR